MQRFPFQIAAGVAGSLGGLALLLTAIRLYSVAGYSVVQRRREIGVLLAISVNSEVALEIAAQESILEYARFQTELSAEIGEP